MSKNLIPIICKELGVGIGDKFLFENNVFSGVVYRFTSTGLERQYASTGEWKKSEIMLNEFLDSKIIKLPFEPKVGEICGYFV